MLTLEVTRQKQSQDPAHAWKVWERRNVTEGTLIQEEVGLRPTLPLLWPVAQGSSCHKDIGVDCLPRNHRPRRLPAEAACGGRGVALTRLGDVPSSAFFQRGSKPLATTRCDSHLCMSPGWQAGGGGSLCGKGRHPCVVLLSTVRAMVPPAGPPGRLQVSTDVRLQGPELSTAPPGPSAAVSSSPTLSSASGSSLEIL